MPNQPKKGLVQISLRVTVDLALRAEYLAEQMSKERPGIEYDRLDAIRTTLATHLPEPPPGWAPSRGPMAKTDAPRRGKEKR